MKLCNLNNCFGCCACVNLCPANPIEISNEVNGFMYPQFMEKCNKCSFCKKICIGFEKISLKLIAS